MKMSRFILDTLKHYRSGIITYLALFAVCFCIFDLYRINFEPFLYSFILIGIVLIVIAGAETWQLYKKAKEREKIKKAILDGITLPAAETLLEEDYQDIIRILLQRIEKNKTDYEKNINDLNYYLTVWVHQIKTPVAVMRMSLEGLNSEEGRTLFSELARIEEYVDMILQYIRLSSTVNDLVIEDVKIDDVIRQSIRKHASQFVMKKLYVHYDGTDRALVTDKKWLGCIIDQILSNAVKYTRSGGVTISVSKECIEILDTGIGIAASELPRIFENGYTGINGHDSARSSGLGLYLAKMSADKLGILLSVESKPGSGSKFRIEFK